MRKPFSLAFLSFFLSLMLSIALGDEAPLWQLSWQELPVRIGDPQV